MKDGQEMKEREGKRGKREKQKEGRVGGGEELGHRAVRAGAK